LSQGRVSQGVSRPQQGFSRPQPAAGIQESVLENPDPLMMTAAPAPMILWTGPPQLGQTLIGSADML
jgi:hypothetical protein